MSVFQRIVTATDLSPASEPAFDEAVRIAREGGGRLFVAHAYQIPATAAMTGAPASVYEDFERAVRTNAEQKVETLVEKARQRGVEASGCVLYGFPDEEIVALAHKEKADLIVMGTHGRRGAARLFLGSVAARVVGSAPCPVLTVRSASGEASKARLQ